MVMVHDEVINPAALKRRVERNARQVAHIGLIKPIMARRVAGTTPLPAVHGAGSSVMRRSQSCAMLRISAVDS